jgi:hypothetical protein
MQSHYVVAVKVDFLAYMALPVGVGGAMVAQARVGDPERHAAPLFLAIAVVVIMADEDERGAAGWSHLDGWFGVVFVSHRSFTKVVLSDGLKGKDAQYGLAVRGDLLMDDGEGVYEVDGLVGHEEGIQMLDGALYRVDLLGAVPAHEEQRADVPADQRDGLDEVCRAVLAERLASRAYLEVVYFGAEVGEALRGDAT